MIWTTTMTTILHHHFTSTHVQTQIVSDVRNIVKYNKVPNEDYLIYYVLTKDLAAPATINNFMKMMSTRII